MGIQFSLVSPLALPTAENLGDPLLPFPHSPELDFALKAVETGVEICIPIYAGTHQGALKKIDASPVTIADFSVQAVTAAMLADRFPDDVLVAEESSAVLREAENAYTLQAVTDVFSHHYRQASPEDVCGWIDRGSSNPQTRFWVMDPVDGTKGFLRGGQYVVALALIEAGEIMVSALGCPHLDEQLQPNFEDGGVMLLAERSGGAWLRPVKGAVWRRLQVSSQRQTELARAAHSFEPTHTNHDLLRALLAELGTNMETIPMDSQAKYAMIAGGSCDLLYRLTSSGRPPGAECIWDHAAGALMVTEAGGRITDLNGEPLDFMQGRTLAVNEGVLVTNGILHDAALDVYRRVTEEAG